MKIKRVVPKSLAKVFALLYAIFGFIGGLFFLLVSLFAQSQSDGFSALIFGVGAPIILPLMYGLMGWIGGYITAWIYNVVAKRVGGVDLEVE